jgi:hypothetical protein
MGKSNAANWANRWAKGVPDRANDPHRKMTPHTPLSGSAMKTWENETVYGNDNPQWKCDNCGNKGAMDYAGQGRVCESCASDLGF